MTNLPEKIVELGRVTGKSNACGWMFDEVAWFLHALVGLVRPEVVIQTGHLWGKSACVILEALKYKLMIEGNPPQGDKAFDVFVRSRIQERVSAGRLITIDPSPLGVLHPEFGSAWLSEQYPGQYEPYTMRSDEFFAQHGERLKQELTGKLLLGVIDGDHLPEGCKADLVALAELGAEVLVVDDTTWLPALEILCREFARVNEYDFLQLPYANGVGLLVRRMK